MRPGARNVVHTAFGLLMAVGGTLVAVPPAAAATVTPAGLPHAVGGFTPPTTRVSAGGKIGTFAALPDSATLKTNLPVVGDQGQIGSCVAWTIAHSIMGYYAKRDRAVGAPYAPLYLYMRTVPKGGAPNSGLIPEKALAEAATNGVDTQDDYIQGTSNYSTPPTVAEIANAKNYKVSAWKTLWTGAGQGSAGQIAMETAISSGSPVAIGMPVYKDFMYLNSGALYKTTTGTSLGGHMVTAYAYDTEGIWIRNQWGTGWGSSGDAHLAWAFVNNSVLAAYTVSGVSTPSNVLVPRPTVSTISQVRGSITGGTEVTITGGNLGSATAVKFGDSTATFRKVETNGVSTLVATAPAHATGVVDVTVVNAAGASALNSQARFQYQAPLPVITKLSTASASVLGGETVTITGTTFDGASAVRIGANSAINVKLLSTMSISFMVPKLVAGIYDVTVVTPSGTSAAAPAAKLAIVNLPAPTITSLSVTSGPTYTTTPVTVTGTNLDGVKSVTVGGANVTFTPVSATQMKVTMPVHAAGRVAVKVVTLGGTVEGTFTYVAPPAPTVAAISPSSGGAKVSTTVELTGANLATVEKITANGVTVSFTKVSENKLKVYLPPHAAGAVSVQVVTKGGTSTASTFTYKV